MRNVEFKVEKNKLTITIDLGKEGKPSKSGKSVVIGSTEGNIEIPGQAGLHAGVNVYKKEE